MHHSFVRVVAVAAALLSVALKPKAADSSEIVDSTVNTNFLQPHVFFTSGGFIPPDFVVGSDTAAPIYNGIPFVRLITIQHAYSASVDLDLQPKLTNSVKPFFDIRGQETNDADGFGDFGALWTPENKDIGRNYGAWLEDFNYFVNVDEWSLAVLDKSPTLEAFSYLANENESIPGQVEDVGYRPYECRGVNGGILA